MLFCLYVDEISLFCSNDKMIKSTKNKLNSKFDMKDMSLVDVVLEVKTRRASDVLILS